MEPEEKYVQPFIRPLLDRPNSTYRHTRFAMGHRAFYWAAFSELQEDPTLIPPRPALSPDDPKSRQLDTSLLLVGNLARMYKSRSVDNDHLDPNAQTLHQFSTTALNNSFFHNNGLVRSLWWMPEHYKPVITGLTYLQRTGMCAGMEFGLSMTEVVGVKPLAALVKERRAIGVHLPGPGLTALVNSDVKQAMKDDGVTVPPGRALQPIGTPASESIDPDVWRESPLEPTLSTAAELEKQIDAVHARTEDLLKSTIRDSVRLYETIVHPLSCLLAESAFDEYYIKCAASLVDLTIQLLNTEANFKHLEEHSLDAATATHLHQRILALDAAVHHLLETRWTKVMPTVLHLSNDVLAFYATPRLMAWNRRRMDPLQATSADFWPANRGLALIDLVPQPRDLAVPGLANRHEVVLVAAAMFRHLMGMGARPLPHALNTFAVNAGHDLIPMVPAITDVRRGGRLNPARVRCRMVTDEALEGLVKAFFEWPFRPQTVDGASAAAPADDEYEDEPHVKKASADDGERLLPDEVP